MAYNTSPKAVERMEKQLDNLLNNEVVTFTDPAPHKLAYKLREAIAAASKHSIEPYASIDYMFQIDGPETLKATPKKRYTKAKAKVEEGVSSEKTIDARVNHYDVISMLAKTQVDQTVFPNFEGKLAPIRAWVEKHDMTIVSESPLKIRR